MLITYHTSYISKWILQKTSHSINHSNHENRIYNTGKENTAPISINDYYKRDQNIEHIPIPENYYGQTGNSYILPTSHLANNGCYENRSPNFTHDVMIDLKSPLATNHGKLIIFTSMMYMYYIIYINEH